MMINNARCTRENKSRIATAKAAFNKKKKKKTKTLFTSKLDFNLKKELVRCYISLYGTEIGNFAKLVINTWKVLK